MIETGKNSIRLTEIDSTNNYALQLLANGKPLEGTVVTTAHQHSGRGQRTAVWQSEKDMNLAASFIFYPPVPVADHFLFNQSIALAVHETIEKILKQKTDIKWPNDILVNNKKIAGILIENSIRGNQFLYAVAGIGININQKQFSSFTPPATSFALENNETFMVDDVLHALCRNLNKWYTALCSEEDELIHNTYLQHLFRYNELALYEIEGEKFYGTITGTNEDGRLLIETYEKGMLVLNLKEVKFVF